MSEMEENTSGEDYQPLESIAQEELVRALSELTFFKGDPFLAMQARLLSAVDIFVTSLEYDVLKKLFDEERTPSETFFLLAQSQMWIFAIYELLRTWRQRAREIIKLSENGALKEKIAELKVDQGFLHMGREIRADQMEAALNDPSIIVAAKKDLARTDMLFLRLDALRVSLAKHEVKGNKGSVALRPGYGRINDSCGSLDFELENGIATLDVINRRDVAEEIRALLKHYDPAPPEAVKAYRDFFAGKLPDMDAFKKK